MEMTGKARPKEASIDVVVIRADGTREDHGTVAYYHRNPLKRLAWNFKRKVRDGRIRR
jgi:hypothetical protein